jgi:quercetin dioxygenase-like cupin family protein
MHVHSDTRGDIYDLISGELVSAVSLVTFTTHAVRGNHIHHETSQWNYVVHGCLTVVTEFEGIQTTKQFEKGDLFLIPPAEAHAMKASEPTELMVFTLGPRGGKDFEKDTFRLTIPLIDHDS